MDMLKSQILTISAMQNSKDGNSIINAIYGIILLSFIEQIFKYLPIISAFIKKHGENYIKRRYSIDIVNSIVNSKKELSSSIILERSYLEKDTNQNSEFVESVLEYVSKLPNIKFLKYRNRFFVSHKDEFEIDKNIYGRCLECVENLESGELEKLTIQVYSYTIDIVQLRDFLNKIHKNYIVAKKNQLGDQTYFFDHITSQNSSNFAILRFDMTQFNTNNSLKTIYGNYMSNVVKRINFFIQNREWYIKKGIPHTLGLLLHGPPGCGKTSLIKAIANDTHRHIINIQLNKNVTQSQLKSLFFNEEVFVFNKKTGQNELFLIPLEQRIYVMEDVDAISDILYSREIANEQKEREDKIRQEAYEVAKQAALSKGYAPPPPPTDIRENVEQLTLAFILNLLDGILETPGRIIILTTNHPEKLDSALVRPGRIDLNIHFDRCSKETVVELVLKFYENIDESCKEWCKFLSELSVLDEYMMTPAEVNKIIFNYYNEYTLALDEIISEIRINMTKCVQDDLQKVTIINEEPKETIIEAVNVEIKNLEKFYLTTKEFFKQVFGNEYIKYIEDKMLLIQDTLLINKENLEHIYLRNINSISTALKEVENIIINNRRSILNSTNVSYEIHEDENGKFIYVDSKIELDSKIEIASKIEIDVIVEKQSSDAIVPLDSIIGYDSFNCYDRFALIDNSYTNDSSLDSFYKPLI
jgi:hypothetical protein